MVLFSTNERNDFFRMRQELTEEQKKEQEWQIAYIKEMMGKVPKVKARPKVCPTCGTDLSNHPK